MCNVSLNKNTLTTLINMGCTGKNFLRLSAKPAISAFIDDQISATDDILWDNGSTRVVATRDNVNSLNDLQISFDPNFTFVNK